ncbi:Hypothetical protein SSO0496 [Saccharolobus solfataricus P2]|uniref:Uncharacterized protein n=2 Tax=Saccharolobus solfataricus TaxID=2287 RepID=Q97ZT2_SACS2|nr:hypothetical protein [Saccharolobus solfataricus]AAK40816.1 Hypothetical protein SSO0496 [Saccharolobus solfataricus P2]SAI84031.1 uncharacterised protein [Saccharolobus solfataricus]
MDKRIATIILSIVNIIGIFEFPLYESFIGFFFISSALSILYESQLSLIVPTVLFASLVLLHIITIQLQKLIILSILMLISIIGKNNKWIYSILITLAPGLIINNLYLLLIVLALLIPLLIKLGGEPRAIIISGILYLIYSGIIFPNNEALANQISQISYFYLMFGIIGIIVEDKRITRITLRKILPYLSFIPASFASIMLGYPSDSSFIYWSASSFYFSHLYLPWIYEIGYNSNQHLIASWFLAYLLTLIIKNPLITAEVFLGIFTFLSGLISYYVFKRLNLKYPLLFSLLYQINIFNPIISHSISVFSYAFLPLVLFFAYNKNKVLYSILTLTAASSIPIFISTLVIPLVYRRYYFLLYALGVNAFWLIPFLIFGYDKFTFNVSNIEILISIILVSISVLLYQLRFKNIEILYMIFISFVLLILGINTGPLILLATILTLGSLRDISILYLTLLSGLIILSATSFSYGVISGYANTTFYTYNLPNLPKPGEYGFGITTLVNDLNLTASGMPTESISYNVRYFIYNSRVIENPLYFGFPIPAIPNYTPQLTFSYIYSNSSVKVIYSPFNKPLGLMVYSNVTPSKISIVFPTRIENISGIKGLVKNYTIQIITNTSLTIIGGKVTVDNKSIFSSYYKPKIVTSIMIGEITEVIDSNYSIYLPIHESLTINGKVVNHPIILPPGKYTIVISDEKIEYVSYASIFLTIVSLVLLIRRGMKV